MPEVMNAHADRTPPPLPCLQVREAMAKLLVAVSRTRALHFYEVRGVRGGRRV